MLIHLSSALSRKMRRFVGLSALALLGALVVGAPTRTILAQQPSATPAADPADVASVDAIISALYEVISGPAGQRRNWDRFRSLLIPEARLIPTGRTATGEGRMRIFTTEQYIEIAGAGLERDGFFEREIGRTMSRYGNIVHAMSAYDSKRTAEDPTPFARGINSIQLWFDGTRWWVVTVFWEAESPAYPIPSEYLRAP